MTVCFKLILYIQFESWPITRNLPFDLAFAFEPGFCHSEWRWCFIAICNWFGIWNTHQEVDGQNSQRLHLFKFLGKDWCSWNWCGVPGTSWVPLRFASVSLGSAWWGQCLPQEFPLELGLDVQKKNYVSGIMNRMKVEWSFVTTCVDKLDPKSQMYKILSWTRSQAYRECMMVAECLGLWLVMSFSSWKYVETYVSRIAIDYWLVVTIIKGSNCICFIHPFIGLRSLRFDPEKACNDDYFMNIAKSVAGITDDNFGSLLSSVPVEMIFGDLRDACKRHAKQEITTGCNIQSVVARSCNVRNTSADAITPSGCDWSRPLGGKTLKQQVFDSSRCTDKSLGVCTSGLTKRKTVTEFTKPHIFTQRLCLMDSLLKLWRNASEEDNFSLEASFRLLWIASLAERGLLIQMRGVDKTMVVLKGGPYSVRCMPLVHVLRDDDQFYTCESPNDVLLMDIPLQDLSTYEVCCSTPAIESGQLSWKVSGEWMFYQPTLPSTASFELQPRFWQLCAACWNSKGSARWTTKARFVSTWNILNKMRRELRKYLNRSLIQNPDAQRSRKRRGGRSRRRWWRGLKLLARYFPHNQTGTIPIDIRYIPKTFKLSNKFRWFIFKYAQV